jgi:hypothetical protein
MWMHMAGRRNRGRLVAVAAAVILPCIGLATSYVYSVESDVYLLVDTVSQLHTELVAGNYTDGTLCFDFPTYEVNEKEKKVEMFIGKAPDHYRLAYGSGFFAGGLVSSGGASGLKFVDRLPFTTVEDIDGGNGSFAVKVTVTADRMVLLEGKPFNGTHGLEQGQSWRFSYDVVREHQNCGDGCCNGTTCLIRYVGSTEIRNYGVWKKSGMEFRD